MALPSFPHPAGNVVQIAGGNSIQSSKSATALCSCASVTFGFNAALAEPGQSAPQGAGTASQSAYRLTEYGSSHSEKLRWPTAFEKSDRYGPVVCVSEPFVSACAPFGAYLCGPCVTSCCAENVECRQLDYRSGFRGLDSRGCYARCVECGWAYGQQDRRESAAQGQYPLPLHPPAFAIAE